MKQILVPVDFSDCSEYALEVAAQLARKLNGVITIFHMMGVSEAVLAKSELHEQEEARYYMKLAKEKLKRYTDKAYLMGIPVKTIIQNYKVFEEINKVAHEQQIDLIIMGSHGASGLSRLFVGSNTEKVVRSAEVPVLVIKKPHHDFKIENVVFACNLKAESHKAFQKALDFSNLFGAELHLVYINTEGSNFLNSRQIAEKVADFSTIIGHSHTVNLYHDFSVEQGIFNFAGSISANLIVIPTHGRKGIAHFFKGSIGEKMANTIKMPIMTIKL
ncbi:universal stress protein [Flagellimonas sp.]|uniref:universal stress protein n=1 Tax=Flagellimonas sp. TaxID=2058762 RepID=UPI003F4A0C63